MRLREKSERLTRNAVKKIVALPAERIPMDKLSPDIAKHLNT